MAQSRIDVVVAPNGEVTIAPVGFKGKACEAATKAIEEALGVVTNTTRTPEYYLKEEIKQQVKA